MPEELLPQGPRQGKLSYTVHFPNGASIEVLLKGRAYMIKKPVSGADMPEYPRIGWGSDMHAAWQETKEALSWKDE